MKEIILIILIIVLASCIIKLSKGSTKKRQPKEAEIQAENVIVKKSGNRCLIPIFVLILLVLLATLPFHYAIDKETNIVMFAKDKLSFKDTFIGNETIQREVNRFNNANYFHRQAIESEYLHIKLKEYGLIWNESEDKNVDKFDDFDFSDQSYSEDVISLSAHMLYSDYEQNTVYANQEYKNKMLSVTGEVYEISSNDYNGICIELAKWISYERGWDYQDIECYFSDEYKGEIAEIKKGQTITIQGKCIGKEPFSIELKKCSIIYVK